PPLLSPILARRISAGQKMVITGFTGPFTLDEKVRRDSEDIIHICAGSGIVPSYSIIKHNLRTNDKHRHKLIYSNKNFREIIFYHQLNELEQEYPERFKIIHTLTRDKDNFSISDKIREGRITKELIEKTITNPERTAVFVCGPDRSIHQKKAAKERGEELKHSFMNGVLSSIDEIGIPKNRVKKESYG
ncbi:MAG: hypothetical protein R3250_16350, partial [Melioribacteraceae bacterium]|nr:hypothetical protein [Melioribacteraceae bacterium]